MSGMHRPLGTYTRLGIQIAHLVVWTGKHPDVGHLAISFI